MFQNLALHICLYVCIFYSFLFVNYNFIYIKHSMESCMTIQQHATYTSIYIIYTNTYHRSHAQAVTYWQISIYKKNQHNWDLMISNIFWNTKLNVNCKLCESLRNRRATINQRISYWKLLLIVVTSTLYKIIYYFTMFSFFFSTLIFICVFN